MYFFIKKIIILISALFIISCSTSSKLFVEQKIDENNKKIISQISMDNLDLENEISEMKIKLDSLQYSYDQNSLFLTNLINRYHLLKNEISSFEAKNSLHISSVLKRVNSLDKEIQQFVLNNDNNLPKSSGIPVSQFKEISSIEIKEINNNIDSLNYQYHKLQNEFDLLVKDLSLIEKSMIDVVGYSTNRVKNEIEKENDVIRQNLIDVHKNQDSLYIFVNKIINSIDTINMNIEQMKIDTLLNAKIKND